MGVSNALLQTCCFIGICSVNKPQRHFCKLPYFRGKTFQLDVWNQLTVLWTKSFWKYPSHALDIIFSETIWYEVDPQDLQGQANLHTVWISIPVPVSPSLKKCLGEATFKVANLLERKYQKIFLDEIIILIIFLTKTRQMHISLLFHGPQIQLTQTDH